MDQELLPQSDKHLVSEDLGLQLAKFSPGGAKPSKKKPTRQHGLLAFQAHIYYL